MVEMVRRDRGRVDETMSLECCLETAIGTGASCENAKRGNAVRSADDVLLRSSLSNTMASLAIMIDVEEEEEKERER